MITGLTIFGMVNYLLAAGYCYFQMQGVHARGKILLLAGMALLCHGFLLYLAIETGHGQNLDLYNILSLIGWLSSGLLVLVALQKPLEMLGVFLFPISALLLLLGMVFSPQEVIFHTKNNPLQLIHILSSVLAVAIMALSGLEAMAISLLVKRLRRHAKASLLGVFLPLETLESLLFSTLWLGFILLSVSIVTGSGEWLRSHEQTLLLKIIFVIIAWFIFAALLLGRYLLKWRGTHVVYWTLVGLGLLLIAYIGNFLFLFFIQ